MASSPNNKGGGQNAFNESLQMVLKMAGTALAARGGKQLAEATHRKLQEQGLGQVHPVLPTAGAALVNLGLTAASVAVSKSNAPALVKQLAQLGTAMGASGAVMAGVATGSHMLTAGSDTYRRLRESATKQPRPETGPDNREYRNVTPSGTHHEPNKGGA